MAPRSARMADADAAAIISEYESVYVYEHVFSEIGVDNAFKSRFTSNYCGYGTAGTSVHFFGHHRTSDPKSFSIALLAFEYLITFGQEVELLWKRKLTGASVLFFFNRYLILLSWFFNGFSIIDSDDVGPSNSLPVPGPS